MSEPNGDIDMETTLSVPDITCGHCARTITSAVEPLDGIRSVNVDILSRRVSLAYDQPADLEAAVNVMASKGYPVAGGQMDEQQRRGTSVDPVCGMSVRVEGAAFTTSREGVDYYFCSSGCQQTFESAEPAAAQERSTGCACCSPS
jgi:YHS domain-containing protein/copper chaperone CopZ